jgi:hypothetical protein
MQNSNTNNTVKIYSRGMSGDMGDNVVVRQSGVGELEKVTKISSRHDSIVKKKSITSRFWSRERPYEARPDLSYDIDVSRENADCVRFP